MFHSKIKFSSCLAFMVAMLISMGAAAQTTIIYSGGHPINVTAAGLGDVVLAPGNPAEGFADGDLAAAIGDGTTGLYGPYDALVLGENYGSFSPADQAVIEAFTAAGGHTVVLGAHGDEVAFLNDTFGYVVVNFPAPSADEAPISRVTGTGPATLKGLDGSWYVDSAPGTVLYTRDAGGDAAFIDSYGGGTVSWLAWDFCDCGPESDQADWFSLLGGEAIGGGGGGTSSEPIPTMSIYALILTTLGLLLVGARRLRKLALQD